LVCLPQVWRHAIISLLVLFHFGGVLCVITATTPGSGHTPWLPYQLWSRVTVFVARHNGTERNRNARKMRKRYCFSKDW
jgi:hypothetical protein